MTTPSPTVTWAQPSTFNAEGSSSPMGALSVVVNQGTGGGDVLSSVILSGIPVGAVITDGTHSFTATSSTTSVNVTTWNLSNLSIRPPNDLAFTLTATAIEKDGSGNLSAPSTAQQSVAAAPLAPGVQPTAETGIEGAAIAISLHATVGGKAGDSNTFASIVVSSIPVGAILTDGTHSFTASSGSTSVDVTHWSLATLKITPPNDANFTLGVAATEVSAAGVLGATTTAVEAITVSPLAPTLAPVKETGVEGVAIPLSLGLAVNSLSGDSNSLSTLLVSAIPVGAKLTDGTHTFIATSTTTSVNIAAWSLSSLTITPVNDANFALTIAATEKDADGDISTTTTAESIVVAPKPPKLAPVAATGVEGTPIPLNLGLSLTQVTGDANVLNTLIISSIPVGAVVSDGTNSFTATSTVTSVNVASWSLSSLTIKPPNDASFILSLSATEKSAQGVASAAASGGLTVKVGPVAPGPDLGGGARLGFGRRGAGAWRDRHNRQGPVGRRQQHARLAGGQRHSHRRDVARRNP